MTNMTQGGRKKHGCNRSSQTEHWLDLTILQLQVQLMTCCWWTWTVFCKRVCYLSSDKFKVWTHYCAQSMSWYSLDLSKHAFTPSSFHSFFAWSKNSWGKERHNLRNRQEKELHINALSRWKVQRSWSNLFWYSTRDKYTWRYLENEQHI